MSSQSFFIQRTEFAAFPPTTVKFRAFHQGPPTKTSPHKRVHNLTVHKICARCPKRSKKSSTLSTRASVRRNSDVMSNSSECDSWSFVRAAYLSKGSTNAICFSQETPGERLHFKLASKLSRACTRQRLDNLVLRHVSLNNLRSEGRQDLVHEPRGLVRLRRARDPLTVCGA